MEEEEENDLLLTDHELCGFILAVVTASSPVLPGTPCSLSASTVGFLTKSGTFLLPISEKSDTINTSVPKQRRKRRNTVGIGSGSVVHQIHALAANRCLSVRGRVVKVSIRVEGEENGRVRAVVMVDVYLPVAIRSGWQFPKSGALAAALLSTSGHIKVAEAGTDIQDTMDVLMQQGLDPLSESYELIRVALLCGGNCFRCNVWCRLPVITPCRHLLCLDCVTLDSERCTLPGCGKTYEMQFPEALTRPENPNPKWPVPKDLIELQPSYRQDNWDPDWQSTSSSKVAYLVQRLKTLREANRKFGYCENVNDCPRFSPHSNCHCSFLTEDVCRKKHDLSSMVNPDKVIIFSQFIEHIHVIEQQLTIAGIDYVGMYSPMHSSNKMKSLMVFQQNPSCMPLLMDGSAALGLDLSFVTRLFDGTNLGQEHGGTSNKPCSSHGCYSGYQCRNSGYAWYH